MIKLIVSTLILVISIWSCELSAISVEKYLTLTANQKTALDKFRQKVEPVLYASYMKQETYLIQWLRDRNFDINPAEQKLRENLKWRKENGIDNMRNEDWSDMSLDIPITIDTYDKTGRPIGVFDISDWDTRGIVCTRMGKQLLL